MAGLDLLRGVAILLVLLRHAFPAAFPGAGVVGVVMFFAISGYLISGGLFRELRTTGRVDLRTFYLRRAYRLVPALLVVVLAVVVVTLTLDPLDDVATLPRTVAAALTWTGNMPFGHGSDATFHLWTLATEEQFYLLWPAALLLAWRWVGGPRALGVALLVTGAACALATVATVVWSWDAPDLAYSLPTSWAGCFVVGAATRWLVDGRHPGTTWQPGRVPAAAALTALVVLAVLPLRGHALTYLLGGPVIAGLTAVLLLAWREARTVAPRSRALGVATRGLVALGIVSYGAYLWNYPVTLWLRPGLGGWAGPVALVLTLALAAASWHLLEKPVIARAPSRAQIPTVSQEPAQSSRSAQQVRP